jgi:hypothetical protein
VVKKRCPNPLVQPAGRFRHRKCNCVFVAGMPGEVSRCACGYLWRADKYAPYRWRPVSKRKAYKLLVPEVRAQVAEFESE